MSKIMSFFEDLGNWLCFGFCWFRGIYGFKFWHLPLKRLVMLRTVVWYYTVCRTVFNFSCVCTVHQCIRADQPHHPSDTAAVAAYSALTVMHDDTSLSIHPGSSLGLDSWGDVELRAGVRPGRSRVASSV